MRKVTHTEPIPMWNSHGIISKILKIKNLPNMFKAKSALVSYSFHGLFLQFLLREDNWSVWFV